MYNVNATQQSSNIMVKTDKKHLWEAELNYTLRKNEPKDWCIELKIQTATKRAGRFETSELINSNVGYGRNENVWTLGNSYSGQLKPKGGEQKAEKTEKTTEAKEEEA